MGHPADERRRKLTWRTCCLWSTFDCWVCLVNWVLSRFWTSLQQCRKGIATSSLVISCFLFTLKKGKQSRLQRLIEPFARNDTQVYVHAMFDTQHALLSVFPIVLFVTVSRHANSRTRWLTGQSTVHSFKPLQFLHCLRRRIDTFGNWPKK